MSKQTGRHRTSWVSVAAGLLLVVGGLYWWTTQEPQPVPAGAAEGLSVATGKSIAPLPDARPGHWRAGAPTRVVIPALSIDAPVVPIRTVGRTLTPPSDPQQLGWWAGGAEPGAKRGSALVTGHTVHTGGGALDHLGDLERGDRVRVALRGGKHALTYEVRSVVTYAKGELARKARRVFSQEVPGRLVLITCADWNGVAYESNTVVNARPLTR